MNQYSATYPVKIISRSASISRLRKMRLSWFAASAAFSIGCTTALTPNFTPAILSNMANNIWGEQNQIVTQAIPLEQIVSSAPEDITPLQEDKEFSEQTPIDKPASPETDVAEVKLYKLESESAVEKAPKVTAMDIRDIPASLELKIKKGNTIISMLTDAGIPLEEAQNASDAIGNVFNHRRLDLGSTVNVRTRKNEKGGIEVRELKLPISNVSNILLSRTEDGGFDVRKVNVAATKQLAHIGGKIESSIYKTGADIGMPASMVNELINAYSYDVDFQRDIRKGHSIDVLYERMETADGKVIGNGNVVFSELNLGDRVLKIHRYTDKNGNSDFYNERGESVRKSLLRTPVNGARITSSFGMREHPLLGYSKMHKGVDFGAPTGTPIYAAGDGMVEAASPRSGYGNYIRIKHTDKYSSAYAHLSRYASGVTPGKKVKQGQIIGYVGSTGASTGPHLHYEILANNEQVNPANVKFKTGNALQGKELASFKQNMNKLEAKLSTIARGKTVASAEDDSKTKSN